MSGKSAKRNSAQLTLWSADFLVKMSPSQGSAKELKKILEADFGSNTQDLLATYDPESHSWKMSPAYSQKTGYEFLPTLPRFGMTRNGQLFQLPPLELPTDESDGSAWPTPNTMDQLPPHSKESMQKQYSEHRLGRSAPSNLRDYVHPYLWPTPNAQDGDNRTVGNGKIKITRNGTARRVNEDGSTSQLGLTRTVKMWSAPNARDHKGAPSEKYSQQASLPRDVKNWMTPQARDFKGQSGAKRNGPQLPDQVLGTLNPDWVAQLMGYPDGWLDDGPPDPTNHSTNGKRREPRQRKSKTAPKS